MPEYVPLEESNVPLLELARTMCCIHLPVGRKVMVGKITGGGEGVAFRFEAPEPGTDRITVLQFGLKPDAAKALFDLLRHEL